MTGSGEKREHKTRYSDSSLYDEVCTVCGATDANGMEKLNQPCPGNGADNMPEKDCRSYSGKFLFRADFPVDQRFKFYQELLALWRYALTRPELKKAHRRIRIALEVLGNTYSNEDMGSEP